MSSELHEVAAAFRAAVPDSEGVTTFRIDRLDRLGIPVVQANMILPDEPAAMGHGYGITPIAAEVGALGELCEEVHVAAWIADAPIETGSYATLVARHGVTAVCHPRTLCLPAGATYDDDLTLEWVSARRWRTDEVVRVPREWAAAYPYQLGRPAQLITPITNGLGAGFDLPHAIAHGVMELLQRDGNVLSYRALDRGVKLRLDDISPETSAVLDQLHAAGIQPLIKLADTAFGIAGLYVVGDDPAAAMPIQITACGEAAHPDRDLALRKALLEFAGSRARKAATHGPIATLRGIMPEAFIDQQVRVAQVEHEEGRALQAMVAWMRMGTPELHELLADSVFSERQSVAFSSLPTRILTTSTERLTFLAERLQAEDLDILWIDCSPVGSHVRVVKVIVPGLECETLSYHRIGWRGVRRLRERGDPLLREGTARVLLTPEDEARAGGPAWFDTALADTKVGALYPLYREPNSFAAQVAMARSVSESHASAP